VTNAGLTRDRSFGGSAVAPLGALGLVFALLLFPAFRLRDFRARHAQEFAWRRRGVAVALADGAVVRAEFWNRGANRTALADEVLAALVDERTLVELDLSQTAVSDEQLDIICRGDNVYKLSLTGTSISDAGLEAVAKMKSVQYLDLTGTSVTDVGIAKLNELTSLKHLILGPSMQVTSAGIEALQRALPDCDIHFFGGALPARAVDPQDVSNAAADGF
jgi:hypothetical protein